MAHYKRGKCRRHCPRAIRGSETSFRARYGFVPVRRPDIKDWPDLLTSEWYEMWHPRRRHGNSGRKVGGPFCMMHSYPAWHDREFHNKPHRAAVRRTEKAILKGADADGVVWPHPRKPHIYYW